MSRHSRKSELKPILRHASSISSHRQAAVISSISLTSTFNKPLFTTTFAVLNHEQAIIGYHSSGWTSSSDFHFYYQCHRTTVKRWNIQSSMCMHLYLCWHRRQYRRCEHRYPNLSGSLLWAELTAPAKRERCPSNSLPPSISIPWVYSSWLSISFFSALLLV